MRARLDRRARLRSGDTERGRRVGGIEHAPHRRRVGRVEHVELWEPVAATERRRQHLGEQRRAAHSHHHHVGRPLRDRGRLRLDRRPTLERVRRDLEPPQPILDLGRIVGEQREVVGPQARDRVECRQLRHRRVGGRVERGMVVEPVPNRRHGRSFPSRVAATATAARRAAARVASMSSSRCASEGNSTSYGPGASAMPSSIIEWKNVG